VTTGSDLLCTTLEGLGVECVFGLPGTQNVPIFEGLRQSRLRTVLATHELAAGFMANGYARASGRVGVLCTIPGPGFTYALTALAEARHDSAALLHITGTPEEEGDRKFRLQAIDQRAMALPVAKDVVRVDSADVLAERLVQAHALTLSGEPGPVVVEVSPQAQAALVGGRVARLAPVEPPFVDEAGVERLHARLLAARRPIFFVGQGAASGAAELLVVAERFGVPVATTLSGRGALPEDHPLALAVDLGGDGIGLLNDLIASADLVVALGCKFSHNGTGGFRLRLPADRLVHVDASSASLGANYPASLLVRADVPTALRRLAAASGAAPPVSGWAAEELEGFRRAVASRRGQGLPDPVIHGANPATAAGFFHALREAMPADAILTLDSGLHQGLARRHFEVRTPRGLITPSDFQSMGFGLPAAIGARLASPERPVVALIGDGGLAMSGLELLTAVRERIPVTVIVFNDGHLGLIRMQQVREYGHTHAVDLQNPNLAGLARAVGARHVTLEGDAVATLRGAIGSGETTLVEVRVGDSWGQRMEQARVVAREATRTLIGPRLISWLKRMR